MKSDKMTDIKLVYDGECPLCRTYCTHVSLADQSQKLILIDARKQSFEMEEITKKGLNIDEGMVLKWDNKLYYGSEAMYQISLLAKGKGWVGWMNKIFFHSNKQAQFFYPIAKFFRSFLLKLLGIKKINNLKL